MVNTLSQVKAIKYATLVSLPNIDPCLILIEITKKKGVIVKNSQKKVKISHCKCSFLSLVLLICFQL